MAMQTDDTENTIPRPLGGEVYQELTDAHGNRVVITFNDLWMIIVCRTTMDGDWQRVREAAGMVPDPARKKEVVERLWKLEQALDGLPAIPDIVVRMQQQRAHVWFNQRPV